MPSNDRGIANPYRFGFVGASDTHTGALSTDESNFYGKIGLLDAGGALRGSLPMSDDAAAQAKAANAQNIKDIDGKTYRNGAPITWGAAGVTGVWAEENTRDSIYDAMRRKETFATSGSRIRVRMFAGYGFDESMLPDTGGNVADAIARAYRQGIPMGGKLLAPKGDQLLADDGQAPTLLAWATRDANAAPLQRLQVIKGWTVDGEHHERVYDAACSDDLAVDSTTHRCPDNGATVDLSDCSISSDAGATELTTVWTDPDFDPAHRAFYYVRVLENPTCRWSTWDALHAGMTPRADQHATIQERAWTSPIWYEPDPS